MVGQEGKTNVPVYKNFTEAGFDPEKHVLQCYGVGWTSAEFLPQERQLFGLPGGFMNDWNLMTNIEGLFVGGDSSMPPTVSDTLPPQATMQDERQQITLPRNRF